MRVFSHVYVLAVSIVPVSSGFLLNIGNVFHFIFHDVEVDAQN